jgi:hypothetical protein
MRSIMLGMRVAVTAGETRTCESLQHYISVSCNIFIYLYIYIYTYVTYVHICIYIHKHLKSGQREKRERLESPLRLTN